MIVPLNSSLHVHCVPCALFIPVYSLPSCLYMALLVQVVQSCDRMVSSGIAYMEDCRAFSSSVKELANHFEKGEAVSVRIFVVTHSHCTYNLYMYIYCHLLLAQTLV